MKSLLKLTRFGSVQALKQCSRMVLFNHQPLHSTVFSSSETMRNFSTVPIQKQPVEHHPNPFEENLVEGITSFLEGTKECFKSGDYLQAQKRYEHDTVKEKVDELITSTMNHISQIEKHFQKERENIVFPIYKACWNAANILHSIGEHEQAVKQIANALESVPKEHREEIPQMKIVKASILNSMGHHDQAFELHNKAISEIGPKVTWKNGIEAATAFHELGEYYLGVKGETGKAVQSFEKALSICEGFYGWTVPQTTKTALILSRLYLETNKVDFSIILGEKSMVGIELFLNTYEAPFITTSGAYLARAYERKGFLPFQQSTITRVYNILRRKKADTDSQTYMECVFKLENMLGSCRFLQGHLKIADQTFLKLDQLAESVMPEWLKKDPEEAQFELAYMKYFKGVCKVTLKEHAAGVEELEQSKAIFLRVGRDDWASNCDHYINEAKGK